MNSLAAIINENVPAIPRAKAELVALGKQLDSGAPVLAAPSASRGFSCGTLPTLPALQAIQILANSSTDHARPAALIAAAFRASTIFLSAQKLTSR
jgi:hypothetical protein